MYLLLTSGWGPPAHHVRFRRNQAQPHILEVLIKGSTACNTATPCNERCPALRKRHEKLECQVAHSLSAMTQKMLSPKQNTNIENKTIQCGVSEAIFLPKPCCTVQEKKLMESKQLFRDTSSTSLTDLCKGLCSKLQACSRINTHRLREDLFPQSDETNIMQLSILEHTHFFTNFQLVIV